MEKRNSYKRPTITELRKQIEKMEKLNALLQSRIDKFEKTSKELLEHSLELEGFIEARNKTISNQAIYIREAERRIENKNMELKQAHEQIDKLYARTIWQRILNIIPE